jgi:hypothetical protein
MKFWIKSSLFVFAMLVSNGQAFAVNHSLEPVNSLKSSAFCSSIARLASALAQAQSFSIGESKRLGKALSRKMTLQLQEGRVDQYFSFIDQNNRKASGTEGPWYSAADLLLGSLGYRSERVMMVESTDELRFAAHVMPGTHLILVAKDVGTLNESRQKIVSSTISALGGKIHVIWLGQSGDQRKLGQVSILMNLAASTGGVFVDMTNQGACRG